ncbi:DUF6183 family protein [Streptomyces sp. NPDC001691]|uniref:DUF6183 family protein n=1 Tax=Streptomyces sp. NPDC001691 TaxID=3364600 RepID=UPI003699B00C
MADDMAELVRDLPGLKSVTGVWRLAEQWLAAGDSERVAELGVRLVAEYRGREQELWQYVRLRDGLLRLLARTPGPGQVLATGRLAQALDGSCFPSLAASLLVSAQQPADLAVLFSDGADGPDELRACLVQELVVRGVDLAGLPQVANWAGASRQGHGRFSWLPLSRAEFELGHPVPARFPDGESRTRQEALTWHSGSAPVPLPGVRETTTPATGELIAAAARNWAEDSNGWLEARVFEFVEPLAAAGLPAALGTIGLECTAVAAQVSLGRCFPVEVWEVLFNAAAEGGAYESAEYGAHGRLAAWRSLAGLTGVAEGTPVAEVEALVAAYRWYGFDTDSGWLRHQGWDLAVVALSPNGRRLAVLAATDTP